MESKTGLDELCEIKEACLFRRMGWLHEDAKINQDIRSLYDNLEGASDRIAKCLDSKNKDSRALVRFKL